MQEAGVDFMMKSFITYAVLCCAVYYWDDKIRDDEVVKPVACIEEVRNAYRILKRHLGGPRHTQDDNGAIDWTVFIYL